MGSVEDHYQNFLARNYTWMSGGFEQKLAENLRFFQSILIKPSARGLALDLGCGSGFQTVALLSLEYDVVAIDSSEELIWELCQRAGNSHLTALTADLREATVYSNLGPFDVVICMGDTLVHLSSVDEVSRCLQDVFANMKDGGTLVLSFRDLMQELKGIDRAIPVRLDDHQLMTTFLEYELDHVVVNDMIFAYRDGRWTMSKSAYRKLRVSPAAVVEQLECVGFRLIESKVERGFCTVVGRK